MSNGMYSVALTLSAKSVFGGSNQQLVDLIGADALLYAAIAFSVFDEPYYIDDIIENSGEHEFTIVRWLEEFFSVFEGEIKHLRTLYATDRPESAETSAWDLRDGPSYRLIEVAFIPEDDTLYVCASCNQNHHQLGNKWRILNESLESLPRDGHEPGRTFRAHLY